MRTAWSNSLRAGITTNRSTSLSGVADVKLDEYRVEAITGGTDAIVEVWVKMSRDGRVISARGAGPDIIMASVLAFVEGINRLIQEKNGIKPTH